MTDPGSIRSAEIAGIVGDPAHGSYLPTRWARGVYPRCICGLDPRDNAKLIEHFRSHGFRETDDHGTIVRSAVLR